MTKKMCYKLALAVLAGLLSFTMPRAWAQASTEKSTSEKNVTEEKFRGGTYRVEFKISEFEGEKKLNSRSYTLLIDTLHRKELHLGTRVPVQTGTGTDKQFQYMDVGQNINCMVTSEAQHTVALDIWVDATSLAFHEQPNGESVPESRHGNPIVQQIKVQTSATFELGKPTIVSTLDDPNSKHVFQIEVTPTRVRQKD